MRSNIRPVSSSDDTCFLRIASAACNAEAKSSSFSIAVLGSARLALDADPFRRTKLAPKLLGSEDLVTGHLMIGRALAARARGTVARNFRRFMAGDANCPGKEPQAKVARSSSRSPFSRFALIRGSPLFLPDPRASAVKLAFFLRVSAPPWWVLAF